jgi:hypothetical protein
MSPKAKFKQPSIIVNQPILDVIPSYDDSGTYGNSPIPEPIHAV